MRCGSARRRCRGTEEAPRGHPFRRSWIRTPWARDDELGRHPPRARASSRARSLESETNRPPRMSRESPPRRTSRLAKCARREEGGGTRTVSCSAFEFATLKSATHTCTKPDYGTKPGASFVAHLIERAAPDALPTGAAGHSRTRRDLRVRPPRSGTRIPETGASRSPRPLTDRRFSETPWSWPTRTTRRGSDA